MVLGTMFLTGLIEIENSFFGLIEFSYLYIIKSLIINAAIIWEYGSPHFLARVLLILFYKVSYFLWITPLAEPTNGVKLLTSLAVLSWVIIIINCTINYCNVFSTVIILLKDWLIVCRDFFISIKCFLYSGLL